MDSTLKNEYNEVTSICKAFKYTYNPVTHYK